MATIGAAASRIQEERKARAAGATTLSGEAWTRATDSQTKIPEKKTTPSITSQERAARILEANARRGVSASNTGGTTTTAQLRNQARQASADLDTDTLNRVNAQLKSRRAAAGRQTAGDRASDTLSGSVQSYGAGMTNAAATVIQALGQDPERNRRQISSMQKRLADGGYSDGKQFHRDSEAVRQRLRDSIREMADEAWKWEHGQGAAARLQSAADRMQDDSAKSIASAKEGAGALGQLAVDVGVAGTQMGMDALTAALTGGSALVPMAVRSFGGGAQEARRSGADLDRQLLYGAGSAALSVGTEKISNIAKPFKKMFGAGAAETIAGALVRRFGESGAVQMMQKLSQTAAGRIALSAIGEGGEEVVEDVLQPFLKRATFDPNARFDAGEAGNDFLVGAILGGLGGGVEAVGRIGPKTAGNQAETATGAEVQTPAGVEIAQAKTGVQGVQEGPAAVPVQAEQQKAVPVPGAAAVNENGLMALTPLEQENLSSGKRNKVISTFQDAVSFVRNALRNKQSVDRAYLGKIPDSVSGQILGHTGIDIRGFGTIMNGNDIRHIMKDHGDPIVEAARGQIPVTPEDIAKIPEVLSSPDRVYLSDELDGKGRKVLVFEKQIGDRLITMQGISDGRKSLQTDTLYIQKGRARTSRDTMPGAESTVPVINAQSEPPQSSSVNSNIPQGADSVKPGDVMEQEVQRLFRKGAEGGQDPLMQAIFSNGKRIEQSALTGEQFARLAELSEQGTVGMDADGRVYQVDPAEHIDRRESGTVGRRNLNAFQYDHPELAGYYQEAARILLDDIDHTQRGGEIYSYQSANAYNGQGYARMKRMASREVSELLDGGMSYGRIEKALDAIINDHGAENYADAKRIELLLDRMLTDGFQGVGGWVDLAPNEAYIREKGQIAGAVENEAGPGALDGIDEIGNDGLGAADAGFTTLGMEGTERTSRMSDSMPYDQYQEGATAMTPDEYNRLFRYQSQTEAKTTHLAEELVYIMKDGKKTFLKDVDEASYKALTNSLRESAAWNAEQMEAARMILTELEGRSYNMDIESEEYVDWLNEVRQHETATGQGIQALSKWSRKDNSRGQLTQRRAIGIIERSGLSKEQKKVRMRQAVEFTRRINDVMEGDPVSLHNIVLEIAQARGTVTGPVAKRMTGALRSAMDSLTFQELQQFAFSSVEALAGDTKPLDAGEAAKTIQVLNMLSSLKTPGRNLTGNSSFYALDALSMDGAALLDMALSRVSGTRSVAMGSSPFNRAMWDNALKSAKMSVLETALDVDMGSGETMYGTGGSRTFRAGAAREGKIGAVKNYTERVLSALERNNSFLLTVPDEFFKGMARGNEAKLQNLIDQGKIKTDNKNYAAEQADALAKYRTFQDDSKLSTISTSIHDLLNLVGFGDSGKTIRGQKVHAVGVGDLVSPFARVAANLASRGVDYNPVNAARGVVEMGSILYDAKHGKTIDPERQAKAVSNTARGITGTAVIGGFLMLLSAGLVRRADDEGDENVAALNRSEGRTGYQFNINGAERWIRGGDAKWKNGDKLLDISSLQPFNELLGVADQIYHDDEKSLVSFLNDDLLGLMYAAADIPVLQTVGDLSKDLILYKREPTDAFAEAISNTLVSSATPNILRSVAQGTDDRPRSINREDGFWNMVKDDFKSRIPGLRQTLSGSTDPTGADRTYPGSRVGNFLNSTLNPMGLNTYDQTEQSQEWQRLREATGETGFYPSAKIPKTISGNGISKELNYEERQDFQRQRGGYLMITAADMMGNPFYQAANDEEKARLMADVRDYAHDLAKADVLGTDSVDAWVINAQNAQRDIGISTAEYIVLRRKYGASILSGSGYEKTKEAVNAGLTVEQYADLRESLDADGNGGVSQEEAKAALNAAGYPQEQKADLWTIINKSWKKNPYR